MAWDAMARVKTEERTVDTSDLHANADDWHSDEAETTLLGYAELEVMGHKVSGSATSEFSILAVLRARYVCVMISPRYHRSHG